MLSSFDFLFIRLVCYNLFVMEIAIGSDHAGFELKEKIKAYLAKRKIVFEDFGAYSTESVDYPDYAFKVAKAVAKKKYERGILVCGSGVGVNMSANRIKGVRAVRALETWSAKASRLHNNSNVLCLAGRRTKLDLAKKIVNTWLKTKFEGGRHLRRVKKMG
jgi:ribose 5-phosphate isomerase B